jgi:membrane-associated phospholipid phosphatase
MKQNLNKKNFQAGLALSLVISMILFSFSISMGKQNFFLLLNTDGGKFYDQFFTLFTYGGEEWAWVTLLFVVLFILKRKDVLILLIATVVFSTLITQGIKNFIFTNELRPIKAIADTSLIHVVKGVYVNTINSFPSGHTSSAFCIYLILCLLINKQWWLSVGLIYALLVGYSRIYLAQHFPLDVAGGIIVAIISVWLSVLLQQYWWKKNGYRDLWVQR